MKNLTLTQLRKLIERRESIENKLSFSIERRFQFHLGELREAVQFLLGETTEQPRDPRIVLSELNVNW